MRLLGRRRPSDPALRYPYLLSLMRTGTEDFISDTQRPCAAPGSYLTARTDDGVPTSRIATVRP